MPQIDLRPIGRPAISRARAICFWVAPILGAQETAEEIFVVPFSTFEFLLAQAKPLTPRHFASAERNRAT
jgi:hypothetical protein